jgi:hypothetical protein
MLEWIERRGVPDKYVAKAAVDAALKVEGDAE